ncbi:tetratricopeptide repeat protein [Methylobrevis pamukkalensis]|uniref:Lipoprotein NlpI n=1 Tax=Methylobrevis pamukkalensis TaxID=1439726 RepID=A0A1E3H6H9_9HYPH|nr:tetratricopeptide repeat protein [Methylobrevis pamukkalensis]ODN71922.1 lipoprotein NlpI [Methylobrevis pamukkalensis]
MAQRAPQQQQQKFIALMETALRNHRAGKLELARSGYQSALRLMPRHADAIHLLGVIHRQTGDHARAIELIDKAIALKPNAAVYHSNRAAVLHDLGRPAEARACVERALELDPGLIDAMMRLARLDKEDGADDRSLVTLGKVLAIDPDHVGALDSIAQIHTRASRYAAALPFYRRVRELRPDDRRALREVVVCEMTMREYHAALDSLEMCLTHFPDDVEFRNFLAAAFYHLGLFDESKTVIASIDPKDVTPGIVVTDTLVDMARYDFAAALQKLTPIYAEHPENDSIGWNLSLINLGLGNLEAGWDLYDLRLGIDHIGIRRMSLPLPFWDGQPAPGKRLLLWSEQGVGDTIRMISLLGEAIARTGKVTVACDPRLVTIVARSMPGIDVISLQTIRPEEHDLQLSLGSLPTFFRRSFAEFDVPPRFVVPDRRRRLQYASLARRLGPAPVVGLCWRSRNTQGVRSRYYLDLMELGPIVSVPGISFVNTQYNCTIEELEAFYNHTGLVIHSLPDLDQKQDIDGSVSLIDCCDLVITANTVVGDIAGASACPAGASAASRMACSPSASRTRPGTRRRASSRSPAR